VPSSSRSSGIESARRILALTASTTVPSRPCEQWPLDEADCTGFRHNAHIPRCRYHVGGVVQGVGFRPFVYAIAREHGLVGFVLNDGSGVVIEAEGSADALARFALGLRERAPSLARVDRIETERIPGRGEREFAIAPSTGTGRSALIPADVATCDECLCELHDPSDRRYRYPFVNCTQCGPRFTIVRAVPYDRPNTTMAGFPMCDDCRREYEDPSDRRFHAEPTCCPVCGPRLSLPLERAVELLREGAILAVKGLGGWHLACDAASAGAVARLRARKHREDKPFALMTARPDALAELDGDERALLGSRRRPIVLLRRRPDAPLAPAVAPGNPWIGVMLPYTPLHHLLLDGFGGALVMTSGNGSDEPIAYEDDEALERLGGIADAFVGHDRPIHRRCEDSLVRAGFPIRRSRGHAPEAVALPLSADRPVLAVGAELKSTFCLARGRDAFLSPHLGDLEGELAFRAFLADIELYLSMLDVRAEVIAHDLHPEYLSTKWALEQDAEHVGVQHHHAHAAACLAEHGELGEALALVFDGTGLGTDGTLWGGELLRCDLASFERLAHLAPVPLPGGAAAIREPWRMAAIHLELAGRPVPFERWPVVRQALGVNAPLSSGMGRLFDAAAALLGLREQVTFEGQAAIELEALAGEVEAAAYPWVFGDGPSLIAMLHDDQAAGMPRSQIAARFHETIAQASAAACAEVGGSRTVVLSGGTFQNLRLLAATRRALERHGFRVLGHRVVPPNDGGISYGQAAVAAATAS
jgi:hydrogenase maturation protein HypF